MNLKKWGFGYCLGSNAISEPSRQEAGRAQGAYFQRGGHGDEAAYRNVRSFYDQQFRASPTASKEGGDKLVLVGCLDVYETKEYQALIEQQDRFVDRDPAE